MPSVAEEVPEVLKLVGHGVRWKLVRTLARSDYRVNDLVEIVGQPQNLVSYHLGLLRAGQLVAERRSSADARDVYYHLDLDRLGQGLSDSAAMLSPSSAGELWAVADPTGRTRRPRVLFICTGNSARSQMAEAILRGELGERVDVYSAGPAPTEVHPMTLKILDGLGIKTAGLRSKGMEEVHGIDFDVVVTLCDKAKEVCPPDDGNARYVHWSLPDPALVKGSSARRRKAFDSTAAEISRRVRHLTSVITDHMEG